MKTLLISTFDRGGAGIAACRLHRGLKSLGVRSNMLVQSKHTDDHTVIEQQAKLNRKIAQASPNLTTWPLPLYRHREPLLFSPQWFPDGLASQVAQLNPDIINLHWVGWGLLKIETLPKFNRPLVWTFHDMWAFTGGCHYAGECDRYRQSCGACPILNSRQDWDLSRWVWHRKAKAWKNLHLTIVTPSLWLANCASDSYLFKDLRVEVIPNGLDTEKYKPINQQVARKILNFPEDKQIILFGALNATGDRRKGFYLLEPALQILSKLDLKERIELVIFGASQPKNPIDLGFRTHYLGQLSDDITLALVYAAADVMIVPSVQEAFGQTASEAMACGTPVVAFDTTGLKDIVEHQKTGYLAKCFSPEDLAQGILWVLDNQERRQKLCVAARQKAEREFSLELQAQRYLSLFTEILERSKR